MIVMMKHTVEYIIRIANSMQEPEKNEVVNTFIMPYANGIHKMTKDGIEYSIISK